MVSFDVLQASNVQTNRRDLLRRAAGVGLTLPVLGSFAVTAQAEDQPEDDMGHGAEMAQGDPPAGFKLYDPDLQPVTPGPKEITVVAKDAMVPVASEAVFAGWTFDGTIPGRMLRVVEGDMIDFTFKVDPTSSTGHSLDFHSAKTSPNENYRTIMPGEELNYQFQAKYPGVYMYHCGTPPILMHIGAGMYGAMIVDPEEGWSPAQEFGIVQSEFYLHVDPTTERWSGTATWISACSTATQTSTQTTRFPLR
jgi:FtsP/CotA-like multicopper oxidase with cupredoxin domain